MKLLLNSMVSREGTMEDKNRKLADAIRILTIDAIERSNSGHPGAPMGMADIARVLWCDFLRHNPANPGWVNRDRFVLSNGHGSMLLYSLLHLTGYDLSISDIKEFRQLHSKTPGHPEYGYTPGVETTTGPLGQGVANAVGMAIAEKKLALEFNTEKEEIIDHHTYVFLGDGCLMEGISHEACSLAGTLGLGKLIAFWDDNGISIDGDVEGWFTDDTPGRFKSYGWQVIADIDGHNDEEISNAIRLAKRNSAQPTLICCKTIIGKGAPNKAGKEVCHGAPLGAKEVADTREELGWRGAPFDIPDAIAKSWSRLEQGANYESKWSLEFSEYFKRHPAKAQELLRRLKGSLPADWKEASNAMVLERVERQSSISSRQASLEMLNDLGAVLPEILGGSADLAGSNLTYWNGAVSISRDAPEGNYLHYGVREFAMSAIANGLVLHGGHRVYCGTFLVFSDYMRSGMRMAALMGLPLIYVLTHDSIGLGEDGPTHQPVEHVASLRSIPNVNVWRPCDAVESSVAWVAAIEETVRPSALVFSRQSLPHQYRTDGALGNIRKGGYVLRDCEGEVDVVILATGSEVSLGITLHESLIEKGIKSRVVSMPCSEIFDAQADDYRESVLPSAVRKRVSIEAGQSDFWRKYVGLDGLIFGMTTFGESAPADDLFKHFGFSRENILRETLKYLERSGFSRLGN